MAAITPGTRRPAWAIDYATSNGQDVGSIDQSNGRVVFTVNVPSTGRYLLSTVTGKVTLDCIDLTYAPGTVPGVTSPATTYEAENAQVSSATSASAQTDIRGLATCRRRVLRPSCSPPKCRRTAITRWA